MTAPVERHQRIVRVPLGDGHAVLLVDVDPELLVLDAAVATRLAAVEEAMRGLGQREPEPARWSGRNGLTVVQP